MIRRHPFKPHLELLEDRCLPTVWGIPWTDGSHLSVSFVPDGTQANGQSSILYQKMASCGLSQSVWQSQILQALQSWTDETNVNFSVVSDNGAPLGTLGAPQGDSRFGDIRIACIPMNIDVLAITTPPGPLNGNSTLGGDIVLNSNDLFTVGNGPLGLGVLGVTKVVYNDLYTVVQHEVGHSLGLSDNANSASVMYESYQGPQTSLYSADVSAIQALYGAPAPDFFAQSGSTSLATAWPILAPAGAPAGSTLSVAGNLTTSGDADYFHFTTGASNPNGVTIQLQTSAESLLAGKITVYGSNQQVLATTSATNASQNLTITLNSVSNNTTYYVKVTSAASTPFAVGAYQLNLAFNASAATLPAQGSNSPLQNPGTYSTFATALPLATTPGYAAATHYAVAAIDQNPGQTDVYTVTAPSAATGQYNTMALQVSAPNNGPVPTLTVYNSNQQPVATQWVVSGNGSSSLQVANPVPGATYYVNLQSQSSQTQSSYRLSITDFTESLSMQPDAQGVLGAGNGIAAGLITVTQTQIRLFSLTASSTNPAACVQMTILSLLGQVVETLTAQAGQTVSGVALLDSGLYIVLITAWTSDGSVLQPIHYDIFSDELSNPVGATLSNPNKLASGSGATTTSTSTTTQSSASSGFIYSGTQSPSSSPN